MVDSQSRGSWNIQKARPLIPERVVVVVAIVGSRFAKVDGCRTVQTTARRIVVVGVLRELRDGRADGGMSRLVNLHAPTITSSFGSVLERHVVSQGVDCSAIGRGDGAWENVDVSAGIILEPYEVAVESQNYGVIHVEG